MQDIARLAPTDGDVVLWQSTAITVWSSETNGLSSRICRQTAFGYSAGDSFIESFQVTTWSLPFLFAT